VNSAERRRFDSGLLDVLVERIARAIGASAVFVTAEAPATAASLLAEFPASSASMTLGARGYERLPDGRYEGTWLNEHVVAVPVRTGEAATGWAVAVGPNLQHAKQTDALVTLLAKCASVLLGQQPDGEPADHTKHRWEDAARDGYWEWDLDSSAMRFSRQSLALLELRDLDRPNQPGVWLDRVHPEDSATLLASLLTATSEPNGPVDCEHRLLRRDGTVGSVLMRALLERDDVGRPLRLVGWLCDVSRFRRVESELRTAQTLADIGRLAAGTAHDFNNFLTVIRGHTELALGSVAPDSSVRENLELIKHAAAGATALTHQLLTLRRRQAASQSVVDLNEVVTAAEATLRSLVGSANRLTLKLAPEADRVRADPAQVERMLINLIVNARDAMPHGGVVTLETATVSHDALGDAARPLLLPAGDYVTLTVHDTGAGMDHETKAQIFEPFFTTKPDGRGTGLGLWIVRDVMERYGGGIDVHSTPGTGTAFVMFFPRAEVAG